MSDLSRTREARRALKTFLKSRALTGEPVVGPVISRRFSPRPEQGVVELTESDIRVLLDAERAARKAAGRAIQFQQEAQRNKDAFLRERAARLQRGWAVAELQMQVAGLTKENTDLRDNVADPPGYAAEETRYRKLAGDLRTLTAERDALQRALDNLRESVRKGADLQATEIRRLRAEIAELHKQKAEPEGTVSYLRKENRALRAELADAAAARLQGAGDMLLPTLPQMFRALFPEARDK
jgi:chromosome segregation ATPase